jgi:hypothetical protein
MCNDYAALASEQQMQALGMFRVNVVRGVINVSTWLGLLNVDPGKTSL